MIEWTKENIDKLRALASERFSATEMAEKLKTTRGAIIGKCRREGIDLLSQPFPKNSNSAQKKKGGGITVADRIIESAKVKILHVEAKVDCKHSLNVPYMKNEGCSDITDAKENTCCGHKRMPGKSYCAYHHNLYSIGSFRRAR